MMEGFMLNDYVLVWIKGLSLGLDDAVMEEVTLHMDELTLLEKCLLRGDLNVLHLPYASDIFSDTSNNSLTASHAMYSQQFYLRK